jgi:hypothetical protein
VCGRPASRRLRSSALTLLTNFQAQHAQKASTAKIER